MSSQTVSPLSTGVQDLLNDGLLPGNLNNSFLSSAPSSKLNQIATSSLALQETSTLLGIGSSTSTSATSDSAYLSTEATDSLTQAVNNELTSSLDAALKQFLPQSGETANTGSQISILA